MLLENVEPNYVTPASLVTMSLFFRMSLKSLEEKLQLSLMLIGVFPRILVLGLLVLGLRLLLHSTCTVLLLFLLPQLQG
jgi:hypothetical protein